MITDSCNCGRSGHGCKGLTRPYQSTWCLICDRNKVKRRCQSEGVYQEGDPLKELNWCCDRGCDLLNRSSKYSQMKKTELETNEKKMNYSEEVEFDVGDNNCGLHRKHQSSFKEKLDIEIDNQLQNANCEIDSGIDSSKSIKNHKYQDSSSGMCMSHLENSKISKYNSVGDYHDALTPYKSLGSSEKDKSSAELRERYIKEMEILRNKLSQLKDGMACDGKRMRQRSESEPGFTELPGGVPKRARDISPKMKITSRKLPLNPNFSQQKLTQSITDQKQRKNLSPRPLKIKERGGFTESDYTRRLLLARKNIREFMLNESDEDHEDVDNAQDENREFDIAGSDDDESVTSNATSASSDSNTPSKVGESLGSISLNETPQTDVKFLKYHVKNLDSVPKNEENFHVMPAEKEELFRISLFPNVPPYVKFFMHDLKGPTLPMDIRRHLKWRLSSITPIVVRRTLLNSGFRLVRRNFERYYHLIYVPPHRNEGVNPPFPLSSRKCRKPRKESNDWTGQWGKHMKSFVFKTLKDFQKLNHFPGTFQIGRKDRLWKNLYRLMIKFGKKEFGFIPKTYILPHDRKLLRTAWEKASGPGKGQWIVKPPAAARGTGIKVVHRWGQIPKKRALIVQKYIAQPYLINGSKFDLRLYVLMTSIHPLRIYLYDDGLVRFASVKYSDDVECLSNRFMHLTNYSINKLSDQYQVNADASSCHGHKWSLKSLWSYLAKEGVNVKALRKNLTDLVIKTIISGESNINMMSKNNLPSRYCSYELFGIDVLLDHSLKPWLLEVNISPSLHSASPLDLVVKGPLVKELLNIAGFQIPAKLTKEQEENYLESYGLKEDTHTLCYDKRLYWTTLSEEEKAKQESFQNVLRKEYLNTILENLTPDDVRHLIQFEDELTQLSRFEKIFPTTHTHSYHQFFESPRYYNMMLDAWETKYHKNRSEGIQLLSNLCQQKIHLNIPFSGGKAKSSPNLSESSNQPVPGQELESDSKEKDSDSDEEYSNEMAAARTDFPAKCRSTVKSPSPKQKMSPKPTVVTKPLGMSSHTPAQRPKANASLFVDNNMDVKEEPLKGNCLKMIAEMRQNCLKFSSDSSHDKLKQFPNCKLENSMITENLSNGKNVLSPSKHIHNACIKMHTTG